MLTGASFTRLDALQTDIAEELHNLHSLFLYS